MDFEYLATHSKYPNPIAELLTRKPIEHCDCKYTQLLQYVSGLLTNNSVSGSVCPTGVDVYIEDLPNIDLKLYNEIIHEIADEYVIAPIIVAESLLSAVRRHLPERPFVNEVGYVVYRINEDKSLLAVKLSANYTNRKYAYLLLNMDKGVEKRQIKELSDRVHERILSQIRNDDNVPLNTLMRFSEKTGWVKEGNSFNFNTENYLKITE